MELVAVRIIRRAAWRRREAERRRQIAANSAAMRQLRDLSNPFELPASTFSGKYRLTRDMARALVEELRPHMRECQRRTGIPVELKVLSALHYFGHGSDQKGVASDVTAPICQASLSNVLEEVCSALNSPALISHHIKFPMTSHERRVLIRNNFKNLSVPGVVGFIDGFHIYILAPSVHEEQYVNRKGTHSLNAQIVADCDMVILNILVRYPGASHDSFIWANSAVRQKMEEVYRTGEECWLFGDSGYPHEPWLQVPILDAAEGSAEANFTKAHMIERSVVERTIGHLRARFRCLSKHRVLHYHPLKAARLTTACAVLHNMCVRAKLPYDKGLVQDEMGSDTDSDGESDFEGERNNRSHLIPRPRSPQRFARLLDEARAVRQRIIARVPRVAPRQWVPNRPHRRRPRPLRQLERQPQ